MKNKNDMNIAKVFLWDIAQLTGGGWGEDPVHSDSVIVSTEIQRSEVKPFPSSQR